MTCFTLSGSVFVKGRRATSICTTVHVHQFRRIAMYETPEITKHEDLSQITFSSH